MFGSNNIVTSAIVSAIEIVLTGFVLWAITGEKKISFPKTKLYLWLKLATGTTLFFLAYLPIQRITSSSTAHLHYKLVFYSYWLCFAVMAIAMFLMMTELFWLAVEPLPGLRRLGMLVFRWVAAVSAIYVLVFAMTPRISSFDFMANLAQNMQRCTAVLELCLVAFLYIIGKPLGMSLRSRLHGLGAGIAILCVSDIFFSGWFQTTTSMYSGFQIFHALAPSLALATWLFYFVTPEPERKPLIVPIKSPFVRWNEIAESLGKKGGSILLTHQREFLQKDMEALGKAYAAVQAQQRRP